ncbi:hypothetical protein HanPSC8_Chr16g0709601 [Helianthus annuus]|nr:hypothetical protein HanPSC8_Chr16g0709601 [Helianthus annuus]
MIIKKLTKFNNSTTTEHAHVPSIKLYVLKIKSFIESFDSPQVRPISNRVEHLTPQSTLFKTMIN